MHYSRILLAFGLALALTIAVNSSATLAEGTSQSTSNTSMSDNNKRMQLWTQEWKQQHPGEPLPSSGTLQRLHAADIMGEVQQNWATMRAHQLELKKRNYETARNLQASRNEKAGITWTPEQWHDWDIKYEATQNERCFD